MPKALKMTERRYGYSGGSNAVGPVSVKNGEEKPRCCAMERAIQPTSLPKRS